MYEFGPEGEEFATPISLMVPFDDTDLGSEDPTVLKCYYYRKSTKRYEEQSTTVDTVNKRFVVALHHFSRMESD